MTLMEYHKNDNYLDHTDDLELGLPEHCNS